MAGGNFKPAPDTYHGAQLFTSGMPAEGDGLAVWLDGQDLHCRDAADLFTGLTGGLIGFVPPLYFINDTGATVTPVTGANVTLRGPAAIPPGGAVEYRFLPVSETDITWWITPVSPSLSTRTKWMRPAPGETLGSSNVSYLATAGFSFATLDGTGPSDSCGWSCVIPDNYASGGQFLMLYTTDAGVPGTQQWRTEWNTTCPADGEDFAVPTSLADVLVGDPVVLPYAVARSALLTPTLATFAPGKPLGVRVLRNPALDNFNGALYIHAVGFQYTGGFA